MKQRSLCIALLLTSLLLFVISCGREKTGDDAALQTASDTAATDTVSVANDTTGTATDTATATHPGSPGGTAVVPSVAGGTTVLVMLSDGSITVREQTIPPGPAVLTIENHGTAVHNLFVQGPGADKAAGDTIPAGKSATMEVNFQPGTYTFYCPLADHRQKGEQLQVTIKP